MDRLTRGIKGFIGLHDQAQTERWALVMLDVGLDTSAPTGEFTACRRQNLNLRFQVPIERRRPEAPRLPTPDGPP